MENRFKLSADDRIRRWNRAEWGETKFSWKPGPRSSHFSRFTREIRPYRRDTGILARIVFL